MPKPVTVVHHLGTWSGPGRTFEPAHITAALERTGIEPWRLHRWSPQGFSAIHIGADITVVLHTWPEFRRATLDVLGPRGAVEHLVEVLCVTLEWTRVIEQSMPRGQP